jgi:hypothetical protein
MATGTVSSVNYDNWQEIASVTTNSGTSTTTVVSGLAGYKKLLLVWRSIVISSSGTLAVRFNSETTNYIGGAWANEYNGTMLNNENKAHVEATGSTEFKNGYIYIDNVLSAAPKTFQGFGDTQGYVNSIGGAWYNTSAITSITLVPNSTQTFTSGTVKLYGIAA